MQFCTIVRIRITNSRNLDVRRLISYYIAVARPKRAASASTTIITFRLTADEAKQLDEAVKELGFKDRSALLRAWIVQASPRPRIVDEGSTGAAQANATETPGNPQPSAGEVATSHSNINDEPPQQSASSNAFYDLLVAVVVAIRRGADPRSGWSRIPNAVRLLLPHVTSGQFHVVMSGLQGAGMLELRPPNGRYERVRAEDAALCPRNSRGQILSRARLIGKWRELLAGLLPSNRG